ncbi:MAG: hypothetical protein K6E30_01450 [Lachnospiraceae bacterium]|nr:hypothetical protein [Lachnospiraceae bacterium]
MEEDRKRIDGAGILISGFSAVLRLMIISVLVLSLIFMAKTVRNFGYLLFNEQGMEAAPGRDIPVELPEDYSVRDIGAELKRQGLIRDVYVFIAQERLSPYHGELLSGSFILNTSQTPTQILEILAGVNTEGQPPRETEDG